MWQTILTAIGGSGLTLTGVLAVARRLLIGVIGDAVEAKVAPILTDVNDLKVKFAAETGGNSNGLRQKLNEVAEDVAYLKGQQAQGKAAA